MYIIKVTICWLGFYIIYAAFLSKETFFKTNRWYLLGTLLLGAMIPLVEFLPIFQEDISAVVYFQPINESVYYVQATVNEAVTTASFDWMQLFWIIYWIGVGITSTRFVIGLNKIYQLYRGSEILQKENHTLVLTDQPHLPFSFFKFLFWSKDFEMNDVDGQKIITHEEAHVQGWHSVDVLLLEILSIIFWLSPMVYFYKKSLKTVHEYLADSVVLQTTPTKRYGHLLLKQSQSGLQVALANHFFHSQLKQRIIMMTKSKSRKEAVIKYLFAIPVILLLVISFAKKEAFANVENNADFNIELSEAQHDVDELPRFPGCEERSSLEKKEQCSDNKMLEFIYTKIKYPKEARKAGIQGRIVVKFTVKKDGTIANAQLLKGIGSGCDAEGVKVIESLPTMIPAKKNGKAVDFEMTIPMNFKLQGTTSPSNTESPNNEITIIGFAAQDDIEVKKHKNFTKTLPNGETVEGQYSVTVFDEDKKQPVDNSREYRKVTTTLPDGSVVTKWVLVDKSTTPDSNNLDTPNDKVDKVKEYQTVVKTLPNGSIITKRTLVDNPTVKGEVFKVVEEMPRFPAPDCEAMNDKQERKLCSQEEMLKFIYSNIKYPAVARESAIEGRAIAQFIIREDGSVSDAKIVRDLGGGTAEEVLKVINMMPHWIPGKQRGKAVSVQYTLPVAFRLEKGNDDKESTIQLDSDKVQPLIVIDGVVVTTGINDINPGDIKEIHVLKGDSAINSFGDAGKNGVIVITMKEGKAIESPVKVNRKGSLEKVGFTDIRVSPNPTSGVINIDYKGDNEPVRITAYTHTGKQLFELTGSGGDDSFKDVKIPSDVKGSIFLAFRKGGKLHTEVIIVQ